MSDQEGNPIEISGPPLTPPEEIVSLGEVILGALRRHQPKSTAQVEVETSRELTYGHLVRESLSVLQGLKGEGVAEGSVVSVVSYNSQEAHVVILACVFLGATVAPIDPALSPEEMATLLDLVKPSVVYTEGGKTMRKVEAAFVYVDFSPLIVVSARHKHPYMTFQALHQPTDPEFKPSVSDPADHVAFILFTSGTSGLPKGVMLNDLYVINGITPLPKRGDMTILLTSPIFWLSGVLLFFSGIASGFRIAFLRGPAKESVIMSTIHNYRPQVWFTAPHTLLAMLSSPSRGQYDLSSLLMVLSGGSALSADSSLRIQKEIFRNRIPVCQGYGMTELGVVAQSMPGLSKPGSVGVLKPGLKCKVVDLEEGTNLGPEREGEICIKGPYMMKGYHNNPEATEACFDDEGYFHTGDIGYFDEDGFIFIVDRIKDLMKYRTYQIAPAELENVLRTHPVVKDVAVFGVPHPLDGDHPMAFVVAKQTVSEQHLLDFVADRVSEKKQLRGVRFVEFIPKTSTGKPKRRALKVQFLAEIQGLNIMRWEKKRRRAAGSEESGQRAPLVRQTTRLIGDAVESPARPRFKSTPSSSLSRQPTLQQQFSKIGKDL
uniref:Luciferin 4-monooxygenase n=1 Tax=Lygus hesperus TaxID=30085 RepID=A0A0K8T641_LYGHE